MTLLNVLRQSIDIPPLDTPPVMPSDVDQQALLPESVEPPEEFQFSKPWFASDPWAESTSIVQSWNDRESAQAAASVKALGTSNGEVLEPYPLTGKPTRARRFGLRLSPESSHDILDNWGFNLRDMIQEKHDRHYDDVVAGFAHGLMALQPELTVEQAVADAFELAHEHAPDHRLTALEGLGFVGTEDIRLLPAKGTLRRKAVDAVERVSKPLRHLQVLVGRAQAKFMEMKPTMRYAVGALGAGALVGLVSVGEAHLVPDPLQLKVIANSMMPLH